jgi:hypothetical protein
MASATRRHLPWNFCSDGRGCNDSRNSEGENGCLKSESHSLPGRLQEVLRIRRAGLHWGRQVFSDSGLPTVLAARGLQSIQIFSPTPSLSSAQASWQTPPHGPRFDRMAHGILRPDRHSPMNLHQQPGRQHSWNLGREFSRGDHRY